MCGCTHVQTHADSLNLSLSCVDFCSTELSKAAGRVELATLANHVTVLAAAPIHSKPSVESKPPPPHHAPTTSRRLSTVCSSPAPTGKVPIITSQSINQPITDLRRPLDDAARAVVLHVALRLPHQQPRVRHVQVLRSSVLVEDALLLFLLAQEE